MIRALRRLRLVGGRGDPAVKRAVVHIGIDKTGTTTIQKSLFSVRSQLLADARILYPSVAANHSFCLSTVFRDKPPALLKMRVPDATDEQSVARVRERYRAALEADLDHAGWDTLLLSAESLCDFPQKAVTHLFEWLGNYVGDVIVVAYVRHPVDWTRSVAQQRLKHGETLDQVYENTPKPNWRRRFTPWLNAAGFERFRLVPFEEARRGDGIVASFCDAANLPREKVLSLVPTMSANESMSLEAALLLDSLNRQRPLFVNGEISPERRLLSRRYGIDLFQSVPGNRFLLSAEHVAKARVESRPDVDWLNTTFGMNLYQDVFEDAPPEETAQPSTMPQETIDALAIMLADLGSRLERAQRKLGKQQGK